MRQTAIACVLLLSTFCGQAFAQSATDKATAQALFDAAKRLLTEGKYSEACPKFAESQRLDPAPGTLLNLADCYERSGLTASAWATWLEAAAATRSAGQTDRERVARDRAAALKSRLVSITIAVPESNRVAGLSIQRDGGAVGMATWGTAVPVDPGAHTIVASAPGRRGWQTTVTIAPTAQPVVVTVPPLESEAGATPLSKPLVPTVAPTAPPVAPAPANPPAPAAPPPAQPIVANAVAPAAPVAPAAASPSFATTPVSGDSGSKSSSTQRIVGYVTLGAGFLGIGIGTIFGLDARSKNEDSLARCSSETICGPEGYNLRQKALDAATYSTVAFGIGSASLITGIVLLATAPSTRSASPQARWRLEPTFTHSTGSLTVKGAF
jgi:hypothetical protein